MWFTETPWPPIFIGIVAATTLFLIWMKNRRGVFLIGMTLVAALCPMIYFVERAILTDAEQIEAVVYQLRDAVAANDVDGTLKFVSPQKDALQKTIAGAMSLIEIEDGVRITDVLVEVTSAGTRGKSHFRANGTIKSQIGGMGHHTPIRWLLSWQREQGEWRIVEVLRLNPISGEEMGLLAPLTH